MQAQYFEMSVRIGFQAIAYFKERHAWAMFSGKAYFKFMQSQISGHRHCHA